MTNHSMQVTPSPSNPDSTTWLIVVMGVSGSGKSTLAAQLARHYQFSYLDADDFHSSEAKARMASGQPLTDVMRQPWVENICARLQLARTRHEHIVLAFSGLRRAHRQQLRNQSLKTLVLFLEGDIETIQARVNQRPNHFMNPALVQSQFEALESPDNEPDIIRLDINATPTQLLQQALDKMACFVPLTNQQT
jgi:gluconokinase